MRKISRFNLIAGIVLAVVVMDGSKRLFPADNPPIEPFFRRHFLELNKPRIMKLEDLSTEDERIAFKEYGYSFRLNGDFNLDNIPDEAIAGHFENTETNDVTFVAILTKRKGQWQQEFFYRPKSKVVMLKLVSHPDGGKAKKGYKAVLAQFTGMPSDDYAVIYWDGKSYRTLSGFDTEHWKGYFR